MSQNSRFYHVPSVSLVPSVSVESQRDGHVVLNFTPEHYFDQKELEFFHPDFEPCQISGAQGRPATLYLKCCRRRDCRKGGSVPRTGTKVPDMLGRGGVGRRNPKPASRKRNSCASQSNRCCNDATVVEQLFTSGAAQACQQLQALHEELNKRFEVLPQPPQCTHREEEKEETKMRRNRRKEQPVARWVNQRQGAATRGFRLVLLLILRVFPGMRQEKDGEQVAEAFEGKEVEVRADPVLRSLLLNSSHSSNLKEESCREEKIWSQREIKRQRNSQGKDPMTFEANCEGRDFTIPERNSPGGVLPSSRAFQQRSVQRSRKKEEVNDRGRSGVMKRRGRKENARKKKEERRKKKKRKKEERRKKKEERRKKKEKKRKKKKKRSEEMIWWKKCRELDKSFCAKNARKNREEKEKESKNKRRQPKARWTLGKFGKWLSILLIIGQSLVGANAATDDKSAERNRSLSKQWRKRRSLQKVCADRTGMQKASKTARCALLNGSTWSTERKHMRMHRGTFDIFFGVEHRLRREDMEEQFNKEAKHGWRLAADAARITDENAGSEDHKLTSGGEFVSVDSNLGAVSGKQEEAV